MSRPFPLEPYVQGICDVVQSVYGTMLQVPVRQCAPSDSLRGGLTGAVYYAGSWSGALLLECGNEHAMQWVARFLSLEPPIPSDDVLDGLGELTNVIAGNLKPLLPPSVGMSPPSVVQGYDHTVRICGGNLHENLWFEDELGPFRITLVEVVPS